MRKKLAKQGYRINADRQGDRDIFIYAQLTLAGFVARYIGLLPSEPLREVDLTKSGVPPCHGQRSDDAGMQIGRDGGGGHPKHLDRLERYTETVYRPGFRSGVLT